jgi:cell wall-associated NlpC family hydrolase
VQVVVMQAGSTNQYDRSRAVSYANNYSAYVCSDGYFWTNGSDFGIFTPGSPAPASGDGDDCAHFCSSCIGRPPTVWGGGLNIPTRDVTYGEPGAAHLAYTDLIVPGYAVEVYSLTNMLPGDLVGWNWENETNITLLDHVTFYLGNGLLASHSASDLGVSATTWYNGVHHYIHILDSPTISKSIIGNKMILSWGTNWTGYAMYSSASLGSKAKWINVAGSKVVGPMNVMTNTMGTSSLFYRLMMP